MRKMLGFAGLLFLMVWVIAGTCMAAPLNEIRLGVILITNDESHCFMFGGLGLFPEKTKETGFLTGVGYDAAFSPDYKPAWPTWEGVTITAVYGHAGVEAAEKFRASMKEPEQVTVCKTLEELFEHSNCLFMVSTAANGEQKDELVPKCLESGKPLFVDKFVASDSAHAKKFVEMAAQQKVLLMSSSLLHKSQPMLEMKSQLSGRKPTRIISAGWSGENIAGDIHPIAHLLSAAENRRPARVFYDAAAKPKTVVTFDDGLIGELVAPEPDAPFVVHVETEDDVFTAVFRNEDLRAAAINQLGTFFAAVRGKDAGMSPTSMIDYLAVWDGAQKSKTSGEPVSVVVE